jgi:hypothetical protein
MASPLDRNALLTKEDVRAFKWSIIKWTAAVYTLQTIILCGVVLWKLFPQ